MVTVPRRRLTVLSTLTRVAAVTVRSRAAELARNVDTCRARTPSRRLSLIPRMNLDEPWAGVPLSGTFCWIGDGLTGAAATAGCSVVTGCADTVDFSSTGISL